MQHRDAFEWVEYCFSTNAEYSGMAVKEILLEAESLSLNKSNVAFLGPDYWSGLCEKHVDRVRDRLDYRLQVTEQQVIDAFRKARYLEHKVEEYRQQIAKGAFELTLANNRTPLRLAIPFSPELTVQHCLEVAMQLLGIRLNGEEYPDLETSARPSVSITIDRIPQAFNKQMGEFTDEELSRLELWITIIWRDEFEKHRGDMLYLERLRRYDLLEQYPKDRKRNTVERFEQTVQRAMWLCALSLLATGS